MSEVVSPKERERLNKAVARELKRVKLKELAEYLKVSRPSVDVISLAPATYKLLQDNPEACATQHIRRNGEQMIYQGYRLKVAGEAHG